MSTKPDRATALGHGSAVVSLVALIACAVQVDTIVPSKTAEADGRALSDRIFSLSHEVRLLKQTADQSEMKHLQLAQWRNY
ncbi:MAG: hypothetical protein ABWY78_10270 [Microvirga sp.]